MTAFTTSNKRLLRPFGLNFFILLSVLGCSNNQYKSTNPVENINSFYLDRHFVGYSSIQIESAEEVFSIDDEMRQVVEHQLLPIRNYKKRANKLLEHIFSEKSIHIAYQDDADLTATQTYHNQQANCMSLTILAFALAKEAGLHVKFQQLQVPEYWTRNGNYSVLAGHVNLMITDPRKPNLLEFETRDILEIDFDPFIDKANVPTKIINQNTVLAMFYNNKGAQNLIKKNYLKSYAYIRKSLQADPGFSPSWSNLGILYRQNGNLETASQVYRHAINLDPENLVAFTNLASLLSELGEIEEANSINRKLLLKRAKNPYYQAFLASNAFHQGKLQKSLQLYRKAIRLNSNVGEFYYQKALVHMQLKEWSKAKSAITKALVLNKDKSKDEKYNSILESIITNKRLLTVSPIRNLY